MKKITIIFSLLLLTTNYVFANGLLNDLANKAVKDVSDATVSNAVGSANGAKQKIESDVNQLKTLPNSANINNKIEGATAGVKTKTKQAVVKKAINLLQ
jgi:hypothetical protein